MKSILLFQPRQMGDVIRGSHCARLLKKRYNNQCEITFVTGKLYMSLIKDLPWIDYAVENFHVDVSQYYPEEMKKLTAQWEMWDLVDKASFKFLEESQMYDECYYLKWNRVDEGIVKYQPNFVWKWFAHSCGLTDEESNDTEFGIPINEYNDYSKNFWGERFRHLRILLHEDALNKELVNNIKTKLVDTVSDHVGNNYWLTTILKSLDTKRSFLDSLHVISQSDIVISRFGGVITMAASQRVPCITIPKPEPPWFAHPEYSHPKDHHISIEPKNHCGKENYHAKYQPCSIKYKNFDWDENQCFVGYRSPEGSIISTNSELFHCWRSVTYDQVLEAIIQSIDSQFCLDGVTWKN
jgi:hypothetical protein